jgi:transposase
MSQHIACICERQMHNLLYFEGAGGETLGQLGHSKDYRPHLKQVVLDGDDRPFASFLWHGNTADVKRLMPVSSACASASALPRSASSPTGA